VTYTYVLHCDADGQWYTGSTGDLRSRLRLHTEGLVRSTARRGPVRLVYYEACLDRADAFRRERFLKTGKGKRYLRLAGSLAGLRDEKLERAK